MVDQSTSSRICRLGELKEFLQVRRDASVDQRIDASLLVQSVHGCMDVHAESGSIGEGLVSWMMRFEFLDQANEVRLALSTTPLQPPTRKDAPLKRLLFSDRWPLPRPQAP